MPLDQVEEIKKLKEAGDYEGLYKIAKPLMERQQETNKQLNDDVDHYQKCCNEYEDGEKVLNAHIEREAGYKASLFGLIHLQRTMLDILCDKEPLLDPKEMVHHIMDRWEIDRLES